MMMMMTMIMIMIIMLMMIIRMVDFAPSLVDLTTQKCGLNNLVLTKRLAKVDLATQLWT